MIKLGQVTVGYAVLIVLLVVILVVAFVRIVVTFKILNQRHTRGKHVKDEHEEILIQ